MKREDGYYFVKDTGEWIIAEWDTNYWYITGSGNRYEDSYFEEIDERRVVKEVLHQTAYKRNDNDYEIESKCAWRINGIDHNGLPVWERVDKQQ